ncbi:MAG: DNA polymerase III subunit [Acidimicrobiia bacterium]
MTEPSTVQPLWSRVVGQDKAVALLQRAAERPVHAYLLVGPRGSGVEEAARCFAAALIAPDGDERAWDLSLRGVHPDVVEIDPPANQIRVDDAQTIVDEVYRSPLEGARKVIVVFDAERMNEPAANKLLKTLEEPPASAVLVLVTAGADQLLPTIRSRCQRVDFAYLGADAVAAALVHDGLDADRAQLLAGLGGGRIDRARAIDGRLAVVRDTFVDAALHLDGTGAAVAVSAEAVQEALHAALADLETAQAEEAEQLAGELAAAGYPDRTQRAQLKRLEERHKRQHRYARTEALVEGITALETMYRDALAGPDTPALNSDRPRLAVDARSAARALDACRAARHALAEHNPAEPLLLERLFLHLPASGHVSPSLRGR